MKKTIWIVIFLLFIGGLGLMDNCSKKEKKDLGSLLPREIQGWKAEEKDRSYDPQTIFDYIDGAGEVYRSYNFRELLVRRFKKENRPEIIIDFFDMASSNNAFGVFTHDLEGEDAGIGQGSTYKGGLLSFWKGPYFVSIYAEEETEETKEVLLNMGETVATAIQEEGEKPDLIAFLPEDDVDVEKIHYFHNHMILNYHFFVADENILLLDQQTEAVLGRSIQEGKEYIQLIVRYPEAEKANQAFGSFTEAYMPDAVEPGLVQTEDMLWTAAKRKDDLLIIVFNAPSNTSAKEMIKKVEERIGKE
jgi:hypothetical protein